MRTPAVALLACLLVPSCGGSSAAPTAAASPEAPSSAAPDIILPAGPLRELVPASKDLPPGMVPVLAGTGPRDLAAVAGYSADPAKAQGLLTEHGFTAAYVGQYADPATGRVLSVVVTRFATAAGATADVTGDLAASTGTLVPGETVGEQSEVRRQPLPQASPAPSAPPGELVTVRFRSGATTWLVAYGAAPTADPEVALGVARVLVGRVDTA
ncbi:MAG: hypothetical protein LC789_14035 [Actinobacteria bacterium]|nr:hypothetical protein [Actinomycetota bacterium]MCA1720771.1 hypothetical protein [Actinomycetota bacterium]